MVVSSVLLCVSLKLYYYALFAPSSYKYIYTNLKWTIYFHTETTALPRLFPRIIVSFFILALYVFTFFIEKWIKLEIEEERGKKTSCKLLLACRLSNGEVFSHFVYFLFLFTRE